MCDTDSSKGALLSGNNVVNKNISRWPRLSVPEKDGTGQPSRTPAQSGHGVPGESLGQDVR